MKKISLIAGMSAIVATIGIIACNSSQEPSENQEGLVRSIQSISNDSLINRGKYLVNIMGCNDCHTPMIMTPQGPGPDTSRLL
ncbi:MAG TPA: diheme cytochrome c-553, partial [Flavisolibacter sp.]